MSELSKMSCKACQGAVSPLPSQEIHLLIQKLKKGWNLVREHHLEKEYLFKNFAEALAFTNKVGALAEEQGHHPDIYLSYGKIIIKLWTHKVDGLTESDFVFAAKCDDLTIG